MWFLANFSDSEGGTPPRAPPLTYSVALRAAAALHAALESNFTQFDSGQFTFRGHTGGQFGAMGRLNLLGGHIPTQLTYYLPS